MNKPYIGITGIETVDQLDPIFTIFRKKKNFSHRLMIGGMVSYKTLINIKDKPIVLMKNEIKDIFEKLNKYDSENIFFTLHYFTKPLEKIKPELKEKSKNIVEKTLYQQLTMLLENFYEEYERIQPSFQIGIQINVSWPNPRDINKLKTTYPRLKTILQVSNFFLLEKRIKNYNVDYILIDTSHGKGIEFEINDVIKIYETIHKNNPAIIGFAGGLSPENVRKKISSLKEKLNTKNFCIDAQKRLRTNDLLDITKVKKYLKEAIKSFQE